jgi:hypothetical protein
MQRKTRWLTLSLAAGLVLATAFGRTSMVSKTHADDDDEGGCTRAALSGVYAATLQGFVGSGAASQAVAAAGFLRLDANGGISGKDTLSLGGAITPRIITGTYTIGRDPATGACRGTATTSVGNFSFATTGENPITGALFVSTVSGTVISGQTIRQRKGRNGDD